VRATSDAQMLVFELLETAAGDPMRTFGEYGERI